MRFGRFSLHTGVLPWMDLCILAGRLHCLERQWMAGVRRQRWSGLVGGFGELEESSLTLQDEMKILCIFKDSSNVGVFIRSNKLFIVMLEPTKVFKFKDPFNVRPLTFEFLCFLKTHSTRQKSLINLEKQFCYFECIYLSWNCVLFAQSSFWNQCFFFADSFWETLIWALKYIKSFSINTSKGLLEYLNKNNSIFCHTKLSPQK